jgi:hypothetical protein
VQSRLEAGVYELQALFEEAAQRLPSEAP